jgi:tagatose-1,6-bisphosphate aldolase non-catalytic subunit AgaZ/GatZ
MNKQQKSNLAVGAGIAATLAAAAAAVYFTTGKHAGNRKKIKKWGHNLKNDVVKELHKADKMSQAAYNKAVDVVSKNYAGMKDVAGPELAEAVKELKAGWKNIEKEFVAAKNNKTVKKVVSSVKQAAKSASAAVKKAATKKVVQKTVKKVMSKVAKKPMKKAAKKAARR